MENKEIIKKVKKELTEWACDKRYKLPLNYGDIMDELLKTSNKEENNGK